MSSHLAGDVPGPETGFVGHSVALAAKDVRDRNGGRFFMVYFFFWAFFDKQEHIDAFVPPANNRFIARTRFVAFAIIDLVLVLQMVVTEAI